MEACSPAFNVNSCTQIYPRESNRAEMLAYTLRITSPVNRLNVLGSFWQQGMDTGTDVWHRHPASPGVPS